MKSLHLLLPCLAALTLSSPVHAITIFSADFSGAADTPIASSPIQTGSGAWLESYGSPVVNGSGAYATENSRIIYNLASANPTVDFANSIVTLTYQVNSFGLGATSFAYFSNTFAGPAGVNTGPSIRNDASSSINLLEGGDTAVGGTLFLEDFDTLRAGISTVTFSYNAVTNGYTLDVVNSIEGVTLTTSGAYQNEGSFAPGFNLLQFQNGSGGQQFLSAQVDVTAVPEAQTVVLLAVGGLFALAAVRRRRHSA